MSQAESQTTMTAERSQPQLTPIFKSVEEQLFELNMLYEHLERIAEQISDARDGAGDAQAKEWADRADGHLNRQRYECLNIVAGISATTVRELGLKAGIAARIVRDWWDHDASLDRGDMIVRSVLEDVMSAAGVARIPRRDFDPVDIQENREQGNRTLYRQ